MYGEGLWNDTAALIAIMREDNFDQEILGNHLESHADASGTAHHVVNELLAGYPPHSTIQLSTNQGMKIVETLGLGNLPREDLKQLVTFRLVISTVGSPT